MTGKSRPPVLFSITIKSAHPNSSFTENPDKKMDTEKLMTNILLRSGTPRVYSPHLLKISDPDNVIL
ncbi:MAG: hypothetical protein WC586_06080 [Methanoregula sp.]